MRRSRVRVPHAALNEHKKAVSTDLSKLFTVKFCDLNNLTYLCTRFGKQTDCFLKSAKVWKDGWVAETSSLLNCRTCKRTGGSNPPSSTTENKMVRQDHLIFVWRNPAKLVWAGDRTYKNKMRAKRHLISSCKDARGSEGFGEANPPIHISFLFIEKHPFSIILQTYFVNLLSFWK